MNFVEIGRIYAICIIDLGGWTLLFSFSSNYVGSLYLLLKHSPFVPVYLFSE